MSLNIFDVHNQTTIAIERLHSFLLGEFLTTNTTFCRSFINLAVPHSAALQNELDAASADIRVEYQFPDSTRIDVAIILSNSVIGVEVKTSDRSASADQLIKYFDNLTSVYSRKTCHIAYLTPFNRNNWPPDHRDASAVECFNHFSKERPGATAQHINWNQVIALYPSNPSDNPDAWLYDQHREFIKANITRSPAIGDRNRELTQFFGATSTERFMSCMVMLEQDESSPRVLRFPLSRNHPERLFDCLRALLESPELDTMTDRSDQVPDGMIDGFLRGPYAAFFQLLIDYLEQHKQFWIKGQKRFAVRAEHPNHPSSGVSVFTVTDSAIEVALGR